jgi:hypothetical protein
VAAEAWFAEIGRRSRSPKGIASRHRARLRADTKTINQKVAQPIKSTDSSFPSVSTRIDPARPATVSIPGAGGYLIADAVQALPLD